MRRFRRPRATTDAPPRVVTLYTRAGCHLCELAEKPLVRAVSATPGSVLRVVEIGGVPELEARYGVRIPVVTVTVDGAERIIAEGKISDIRVRRALDVIRVGA
jgi:hypothetical protein